MKLHVAAALALLAITTSHRAQADEARALSLFEAGRELAKEGRCAEAIPIFFESAREHPGVGAFLNLGSCSEKTGKPATARRYFRRAEEIAIALKDPRTAEAHERVAALEKISPRLTVRVADGLEADLTLKLDGEPLPRERWNVSDYVDPGVHVVEATSARRPTTTQRIMVRGAGEHSEIVVTPIASRAAEPSVPPLARDEPGKDVGTQRVIGWTVGGIGAGALVAGGLFGALSLRDHDKLVERCPTYPTCDASLRSELDDLNDSARTKGNVATTAIVAGAILVVGGVALLLTAR